MVGETDLGIDDLSHYKEIGSGGFATVYTAWDTGFRRWIAVKVLHSLDDNGRRRFDRERGLMGQLDDHVNVVTPYRFGQTNTGNPYLIMEYLRGGSLEDLIEDNGPCSWQEAIDYLLPIASALGRAHTEGIFHRDVKPANILLTGSGVSKLTDFGIADIRGADQTQIAFTLSHVAPETFDQEHDGRDERSDLYSLASTLYYLVAGRAPFHVEGSDSPFAYMNRIMNAAPPRIEGLPDALQTFFDRSLAKNPGDRHRTAAQFISELEQIKLDAQRPVVVEQPPPPNTGRRRLLQLGVAGLAALALVGSLLFFARGTIFPEATPDRLFFFGHTNNVSEILELPDERIASASDDGTVRIWRLDDAERDPLIFDDHTDRVFTLELLPDGRMASASADGTVRVWDPEAPDEQAFVFDGHEGEVWGVEQLSDGRVVSGGMDTTIQVWNPDEPSSEAVVFAGHSAQVFGFAVLDDDRIASASLDQTLQVWDPNQPGAAPLVFEGHEVDVRGVIQLSTGRQLASFSDDQTIRVWDLDEPDADPLVFTGHEDFIYAVVELNDGRLASASADGTIRIWDLASPAAEPVILEYHNADVLSLRVLPDGRLASGGRDRTVKVWDPERPEAAPLTFTGHAEEVWSLLPLADGRVASTGGDDVVRVWNPDTAT